MGYNYKKCNCRKKTPDGYRIDARGIPEGGKPVEPFSGWSETLYEHKDGSIRFRYNQGCPFKPCPKFKTTLLGTLYRTLRDCARGRLKLDR